jgi:hypothetical protein
MAADAARWQQYFRDAPPQPGDEQVGGWSHAQLVRMDNRLRARLLRAFKRGKENRQVATANAREWPPARLTHHRRPLGVPRNRACSVVSDTMHEAVTERLAL